MAVLDRPKTAIDRIALLGPFRRFLALESAGGLLLLFCAVLALGWANSPWAAVYHDLFHTYLKVTFGGFEVAHSLLHWINDGLMALFFFVVGLEIKREVLVGELRSPRKAALALAGALGGMAIPALFYVLVARGTEGAAGWGIPMATDIAFALGVLILLGKRAPFALKVFLTALAIADDLGAVLVIALFYTAEVNTAALVGGLALVGVLYGFNRLGIRRTWPYVVVGLAVWLLFLLSGVHATVAGVLVALTIPATRLIDEASFAERMQRLLDRFKARLDAGRTAPDAEQMDALHALEYTIHDADAPLFRMEHALHPWVAFFILPLFALGNAGVSFGAGLSFGHPVTLGIILGLVLGKPIGVLAVSWLAVRTGIASLPEGVSWKQMAGVACLTGIGFTMSLFIATLAFGEGALLDAAKVGILVASLVSGVLGWVLLSRAAARQGLG